MKNIILLITLFLASLSAFAGYSLPKDSEVLSRVGLTKSAELDSRELKVLVWNVFKGDKKKSKSEMKEFAEGKDLLILQEAVSTEEINTLFSSLNGFQFDMAWAWKKSGIFSGVVTGSSAVVKNTKWVRSAYSEPFVRTKKMILFTEYKLSGINKTLLVGNIHAINFVGKKKFVQMIKAARDYMLNHKGPIIFAGDFNTWTKGKIKKMRKHLGKVELEEVVFPKDDCRITTFGHSLDRIWFRGLKVRDGSVDAICDSVGSDHRPLVVEFHL